MEYFIDKICTILTQPVNKNFADKIEHANFFTGLVKKIDRFPNGISLIWLEHLQTKSLSAFNLSMVVGILEEQVIKESDPRYSKLKEEAEKIKKPAAPSPFTKSGDFVPVEDLTKLIKEKYKPK